MKRCPKCKARNEDSALTCSLCSERLAASGSGEVALSNFEPRLWNQGKQRHRGELSLGSKDGEDESPAAPAAPADDPTVDRYYLLPPVGDPLRIDPSKCVVFGRDEGCDVKVGSNKVSRRHAEVRIKNDRICVRDLNSQNGTYVNDERLADERPLHDGDVIRLGDFVATYRHLLPGQAASELHVRMNETAVMDTVNIGDDELGVLKGDASLMPVQEVLRRLTSLRANGTLKVDLNGLRGSMTIQDGKAVDASYAGLEGLPAVQAMASLTKGHFAFEPGASAPFVASGSAAPQVTVRPAAAPPRPTMPLSGPGAPRPGGGDRAVAPPQRAPAPGGPTAPRPVPPPAGPTTERMKPIHAPTPAPPRPAPGAPTTRQQPPGPPRPPARPT